MHATLTLLRREPRARRFFSAHGQSALGNGAGYVALVVLAYEAWASPWAISLVLLADFLPAMLFGPIFGAAADRWSRRTLVIVSDVMRAVAFIGVALVGGIWAIVALALLAGAGAGISTPAVLSALPSLVEEKRLPAATSLYGALTDAGRAVGPAIAALGLLLTSVQWVAAFNGITFLVSAAVLATISFGRRPERAESEEPTGLLREAREGISATARMAGVRVLIGVSSGLLLFAAMLNVTELLVAEDLGSGDSGYSVLVAFAGIGFIVGSLAGAGGAPIAELKRRYLGGIGVMAVGIALFGLAPVYLVALIGLGLTGVGNGLLLTHERLIFQKVVPDRLLGRAFALADTAGCWAFAIAFASAGALVEQLGIQAVLLGSAAATAAIWLVATFALRSTWTAGASEPRYAESSRAGSELPASTARSASV
ncbi:MAG TPA: MFS transporter [Thermoleophilaceae bacterium]|nr:MFS transporter [Thermoleophilaceae bacterium]